MRFYRILEVGKDQFIPQFCDVDVVEFIFFSKKTWRGIDLKKDESWLDIDLQKKHCVKPTLEEANKTIDEYKLMLKIRNAYPVIHKYKNK